MDHSNSSSFDDSGSDAGELSTAAEFEIEQTLRRSKPSRPRVEFSWIGDVEVVKPARETEQKQYDSGP